MVNDKEPKPKAQDPRAVPFAMKVSATADGMVLIEQLSRSTGSQTGLFLSTFQLRIPPEQAAGMAKQIMQMANRAAMAKPVIVAPAGALPKN